MNDSRAAPSPGTIVGLAGMILGLAAFAATAQAATQSEIVVSDVNHLSMAFDDAAKAQASKRGEMYATEYFDVGSQGPEDFVAFRKLTPELRALYPDVRFPAHVYFVVGAQRRAGMNSDRLRLHHGQT